jgi:hypothetical protein
VCRDVGSSAVGGHRVVGFQEAVEQQDAGLSRTALQAAGRSKLARSRRSAEVRRSRVMRIPLTSRAVSALIAIASMS